MHYRNLGKSNLKVSTLCLGTMMFGDQTERAEAANIVAHNGGTRMASAVAPSPLPNTALIRLTAFTRITSA